MGDADSEIIVPVNEIESWMDEALGVVDEGLDHLFLYMMNVNDRTKQTLKKLESLEHISSLILAMNVLIVPVVISVLLCFSTRNTVDRYGLEIGYQIVVTFLMFLSGSLGFPLYVSSLWKLYNARKLLNKESVTIRQSVPRTDSGRLDSSSLSEDSFLTFMSNEASFEIVNDFARMLNNRMPGNMRAHFGRRRGVFRFDGLNEDGRIVSLATESSSNQHLEGMITENSSVSDFKFQEATENMLDPDEKISRTEVTDEKNRALITKLMKWDIDIK